MLAWGAELGLIRRKIILACDLISESSVSAYELSTLVVRVTETQ